MGIVSDPVITNPVRIDLDGDTARPRRDIALGILQQQPVHFATAEHDRDLPVQWGGVGVVRGEALLRQVEIRAATKLGHTGYVWWQRARPLADCATSVSNRPGSLAPCARRAT